MILCSIMVILQSVSILPIMVTAQEIILKHFVNIIQSVLSGADGNRSKYRRYEMGEASALLADLSIVTAGHNRYETFDQIFADIKIGIDKAQKEKAEPVSYLVIPNRKEAIRYAIEHAQEGDMITILGLGHESYQEENGVKTPHSDIQFAAQCCKEYYPQG